MGRELSMLVLCINILYTNNLQGRQDSPKCNYIFWGYLLTRLTTTILHNYWYTLDKCYELIRFVSSVHLCVHECMKHHSRLETALWRATETKTWLLWVLSFGLATSTTIQYWLIHRYLDFWFNIAMGLTGVMNRACESFHYFNILATSTQS